RDLLALRESLNAVPQIQTLIAPAQLLAALSKMMDDCDDVRELIDRALSDEPPATLNNMGVIRPGFSDELDDVMEKTRHAREWIAELEPHERQRTGIPSLKVGFNKVFGYYIEVSHANTDKVPDDYIRKQTLVNAERYITPELKEYESLVLNAEEQILQIERRLFDEVCHALAQHAKRLLDTARGLAHLDTFAALADVAVR
ncbi:MAG: DNA mismatch repair protein MutS, partial [Gemmatimonadetes bacterium]|nr:DNA mismatch repair protein MutS [Gemmatimonadota bacterium]